MDNPLVSVVVITYNSSKYILECLDSIYNQTYQKIELIISDDCSKDNTVEICRDWLAVNDDRFLGTNLVLSEINTGVSANCNRGVHVSHGEWVKLIAGDDLLLSNCLWDNVCFINKEQYTEILYSNYSRFGDGCQLRERKLIINPYNVFTRLNTQELKILMCNKYCFPTPTMFVSRKCLENLSGFDENIPFAEDWPFCMKALFCKKTINFYNKTTVSYRVHGNSISNNMNQYYESRQALYLELLKYAKRISYLYWLNEYLKYKMAFNNHIVWKVLLLSRFINPYTYILKRIYLKCM